MIEQNNRYKKILALYTLCLAGWAGWLFVTKSLLFQVQPDFLFNRLDLTLNLILSTGLHSWVLEHPSALKYLDLLFLIHPLFLWVIIRWPAWTWLSIPVILFNLTYSLMASAYTLNSIQCWIGWFLIPVLFMFQGQHPRAFALAGLRLSFVLIFFSAGLWKIRAGGIFDVEVMSGILITQHTSELAYRPDGHFAQFIEWLIEHPMVGYGLYSASCLLELIYGIGLFTRRWDKWLSWSLIAFILLNLLIMRINYTPWLAFLGIFWNPESTINTMDSTSRSEQ
jgi:hypothetical protein